MDVFNRHSIRLHRDRAAPEFRGHDFLFREVALRLADRLDDIKRTFPLAADVGCHGGELARQLKDRGGIETLVQCDLSPKMARRAADRRVHGNMRVFSVAADEELLPFAAGRFDLIVSSLSLHWTNDLPGALVQIRRALKPDGLFLGAFLGGETLTELRGALAEAEIAEEGGLSPRVSPFADVRDAGALLQRTGFALPVVDCDTLTVSYPDPLGLMADLRRMGESNAVLERRKAFTRRATLLAAAMRYQEKFADEAGRVPATFQVIYMTAWAPDASQPKPLRPGQAKTRLADALGTIEIPAGEKPKPA